MVSRYKIQKTVLLEQKIKATNEHAEYRTKPKDRGGASWVTPSNTPPLSPYETTTGSATNFLVKQPLRCPYYYSHTRPRTSQKKKALPAAAGDRIAQARSPDPHRR
jgi:hypothetical protein